MILRVRSSVIGIEDGRTTGLGSYDGDPILAEFKAAAPSNDVEPTRASIQLPGLDIKIVHQRSPNGAAEQISINMQAVPSFEAFGRFLENANPFAFWIRATQLAWAPWLEAMRMMGLPWAGGAQLPDAKSDSAAKFKLTKA